MYVIKRDGTQDLFDKQKIIDAINKAFVEVDGILYETDTAEDIAQEIEDLAKQSKSPITVEAIQNCVEDLLMVSERRDVARAYIRFRYKREVARERKADFMDAIAEKLEARNVKNQNANVDEYSFGGRKGEASDVMTKQYALENCISNMARDNHLNNRIYIHDLSAYATGEHNCLTVPFDDLLAKGFETRQTDVRTSGSVNTAFQLVAVIFQLQSLQQFGGVAASHLDWTMVPYVRRSFRKHFKDGLYYCHNFVSDANNLGDEKFFQLLAEAHGVTKEEYESIPIDHYFYSNSGHPKAYEYAMKMTEREVYQAVEGMYHNLNTLQSRSGNQLPFTSINYGTCTLPEGRMIIKALLEVSIEGLGKNRKTPIFPCSIFQLGNGINKHPGDPNYDLYELALRSTAQRLYPNYANIDWSGNEGYDKNDPRTYFATMGK